MSNKLYEEIDQLQAENKSLKEQLHKDFEESIAVIHDEGAKRIMAEKMNEELLAAINSEPELPGNMSDEMWEAIRNDRDAMTKTMRIIVRQTKANIKAAIAKAGTK